MAFSSVFLSVVFVVRNQAENIEKILADAASVIAPLVSDYELIVVDYASEDNSIAALKRLTLVNGHPNLHVYALTKEVGADTASWVGLENALGDFIAVLDPLLDDINFMPQMLDKVVSDADVVFATNQQKPKQSLAYKVAYMAFDAMYKTFNNINLGKEVAKLEDILITS